MRTIERRKMACENCGLERLVPVSDWGEAWGAHHERYTWPRFCSACDLLHRAQRHEQAAKRFRDRASAIFAKRRNAMVKPK